MCLLAVGSSLEPSFCCLWRCRHTAKGKLASGSMNEKLHRFQPSPERPTSALDATCLDRQSMLQLLLQAVETTRKGPRPSCQWHRRSEGEVSEALHFCKPPLGGKGSCP